MPHEPPPFHSDSHTDAVAELSPSEYAIVALTLVLLAWGTFAFGAVYPWAHRPLSIGAVIVGVVGLEFGRRRLGPHGRIFACLIAIGLLAAVQLIPLSQRMLATLSPGTDQFLRSYDLRYALGVVTGPDGEPMEIPIRHAISVAPVATLQAIGLLGGFTVLLAGLLRALTRDSVLTLTRGIVWMGVALAVVGVVQKMVLGDDPFLGMKIYGFWAPRFKLTTPFGPFVNKNHFAGWMLMVLPLAFGLMMGGLEEQREAIGRGFRRHVLWLSSPEGGHVTLMVGAAVLMTLALVMTRSRSGLLCLAVVLAVTAMTAGRRLESRGSRVALVALLSLVVLVPLTWAGSDTAIARLGNAPGAVALRKDIWQVAIAMFRDFPILGTGLDSFGVAAIVYQGGGPQHYQEAHNDYLQLLAEGGLLMGVVALLAIAFTVAGVNRRFRRDDDRIENYWVRAGATIGLVAIAIQSLVEFSLQMPGNALLFTVLLAIALHSPARPRSAHS